MDFPDETTVPKTGDFDSGLENSSDSENSYDTDAVAVGFDRDDLLHSDTECAVPEKEDGPKLNSTDVNKVRGSANEVEEKILDSSNAVGCDELFLSKIKNTLNLNESDLKDVIGFYRNLLNGQYETVDFAIGSTSRKPDWLDEGKFKRGQKFARDHFFCINFAEMISLFILFAQKSSLGTLIFTGKSDTPFKAFKRYLATVSKLLSWYTDDIWSESENDGRTNLVLVRGMHKTVYQNLAKSSEEELKARTTLGDPERTALWCPMRNTLAKDFQNSIPPSALHSFAEDKIRRTLWVDQAGMSITQFGFVGLAVTYPKAFGLHAATEDDLGAFLHMWRGLGYLLGIRDEYNFCNADLNAVRTRTRFFLEAFAKPSFRNVTHDWEHMCRCMTAGISFYLPRVSFEPSLLYLCHILGIDMPGLKKKMAVVHYVYFHLLRLVFYLMRYSLVLHWLNSAIHGVIRRVKKAPPEILTKWENKQFEYMQQPGKSPLTSRS